LKELRASEDKISEKLKFYMLQADFQEEIKKYSLKNETMQLRQDLGKHAKAEDVKKEILQVKDAL